MKLRPINKKGDLSLSINAIVILILAITVMGLGLTFIRGLFKGATEKLGGALEATDLKNPPSLDTPLTVDKKITVSPGEKKTIEIGVYNPSTDSELTDAIPAIKEPCVKSAGGNAETGAFTLATTKQLITKRGTAAYGTILTVKKDLAADTYICTVIVKAGSSAAEVPGVSASTFIEVK